METGLLRMSLKHLYGTVVRLSKIMIRRRWRLATRIGTDVGLTKMKLKQLSGTAVRQLKVTLRRSIVLVTHI